MNIKIELLDIFDAKNSDQESPHQHLAEDVIHNGGSASIFKNGILIGEANTIEQFRKLLGGC